MSETTMLVKVDSSANNNKFYKVELGDDGQVVCSWGRVGYTGSSQVKGSGRSVYNRLIQEKSSRGYQRVDVVDASTAATGREVLREVSLRGLVSPGSESDPTLLSLINRLVDANAHDIGSTSGGKIKVVNGQVTTPVGLLSTVSLDEAAALLQRASSGAHLNIGEVERYFTLVPQNLGMGRGWETWLQDQKFVAKQRDFLAQLRDSIEFSLTQARQDANDLPADLFRMRLAVLSPSSPEFAEVQRRFEQSRNENHSAVSGLKLKRVYVLTDQVNEEAYQRSEQQLGNVRWMWHGTRAINVLSILSKGFQVPDVSSPYVTGRMFGNGVYFSEQSTKSLQYSAGVWAGTRETATFMVLSQIVTGWQFRPTSSSGNNWAAIHSGRQTDPVTKRRFNSVYVKAGTAGVRNQETVIWNSEQIGVRYLCEFGQ